MLFVGSLLAFGTVCFLSGFLFGKGKRTVEYVNVVPIGVGKNAFRVGDGPESVTFIMEGAGAGGGGGGVHSGSVHSGGVHSGGVHSGDDTKDARRTGVAGIKVSP
jgi:hypothetical protein